MHISMKTVKRKIINLEVEDNSNTIDLKIHGEPILELVIRLGPGQDQNEATLHINMVTLTGMKRTFEVKGSNTIEELKIMWKEMGGVPVDRTRLIFAGQELENSRTIAECNIKNDSTIHVAHRLCGC